ncbi:MAG: YeeE/YedE family protein, partial [Flavobacteriaceae bacterium]
ALTGGIIASQYLSTQTAVSIHPDVVLQLQELNILDAGQAYMPESLFGNAAWTDLKSLSILAVGGFLVGFGARYAGGCTSGHAISGLSNLQLPSLIAVIGFFIGGIIMNHYLIRFIL